ncbi:MAG: hemolysin family protein [Planctomycetota bacterium]
MLVFVIAVTTALVVSFACSLFEAVLLSLGHAQVERMNQDGRTSGRILARFREHPDVPLAAILILNTIAHTIGASVAGATYGEVFDPKTLWIFSLVFTVAILLFTEIIPKTIGVSYCNRLAGPVAILVNWLTIVLRPILAVVRLLTRLLRPKEETPVTSVDELRILASLGRDQGVLRPKIARIIEGASHLRSMTVKEVMLPRSEVTFLSESISLDENLARIGGSGHSRFPFAPGLELDKVTGIILAKELAHALLENGREKFDWNRIMRPVVFVPDSLRLYDALTTFQRERRHLAVVVDEYGGTSGIITLEDIIEELIGEIWDETDPVESAAILERAEGGWTAQGNAEMRVIARELDIDPEDPELGDAVTLSGFITSKLERLPKSGDVVTAGAHRYRVVRASTRRAEHVEIEVRPDSELEAESEA